MIRRWATAWACTLCCGCAPGLVQSSPTLRGLDDEKVFVERRSDTADSDFYTVTYVDPVPPEVAWEAAATVSEWLEGAARIDEVRTLSAAELPDERFEEQLEVCWSDGKRQRMVLSRIKGKGLIDVQVDPTDRAAGDMAHITVQMDQYRRNTTLVEVEVRLANSFSNRLLNFVLLPIGLVGRGVMDEEMRQFCVHMAERHRAASTAAMANRLPATGRTHVVAIGVAPNGEGSGWGPIAYAEKDARDFYEWAQAEYPAGADDQLVRELIVGRGATDDHISKVVGQLFPEEKLVREGDTIIFYFAGHIDTEKDLLRKGQDHYLVTDNAERGNLRATATKKDWVLDTLRCSAASQCLFICDACYSGGDRRSWIEYASAPATRKRGPVPPRDFQPEAPAKLAILAAASAQESAVERDDLGHGVFTHAILTGLQGDADADRDGYVSLSELEAFVREEVLALTERRQTPDFQCPDTVKMRWKVAGPTPPSSDPRSDEPR